MDCSPPDSSVHGIFQVRILEWTAISLSRWSSWPRDRIHISCIGRQVLYHWATLEAHHSNTKYFKEIILKNQKWIGEEMLQHQSFISSILFFSDFVLISLGAHIIDYQEIVIKNNYFRKLDLHWNLCFQKLVIIILKIYLSFLRKYAKEFLIWKELWNVIENRIVLEYRKNSSEH